MDSDAELEKAKNTMANGIRGLWITHGGKPSKQLDAVLEENPDISVEIWLDVLTRIKDPQLIAYVVQYLNLPVENTETTNTDDPMDAQDLLKVLLSKEMLSSYVVTGIALYFIVGFIKDLFGH